MDNTDSEGNAWYRATLQSCLPGRRLDQRRGCRGLPATDTPSRNGDLNSGNLGGVPKTIFMENDSWVSALEGRMAPVSIFWPYLTTYTTAESPGGDTSFWPCESLINFSFIYSQNAASSLMSTALLPSTLRINRKLSMNWVTLGNGRGYRNHVPLALSTAKTSESILSQSWYLSSTKQTFRAWKSNYG